MKQVDWEAQSSTSRLTTMKRYGHAGFNVSDDLINQIAKTRLVEDELLTEKIKT